MCVCVCVICMKYVHLYRECFHISPAPPVPPPPVANGSEIETDDGPEEIYEDTIMATE